MPYRVAVWSTGGVGKLAIRAIAHRPDMELVAAWVHSPEKAGVDAGLLAGIDPLGVLATRDAEALIVLKPDCIAYAGLGESTDPTVTETFVRFLQAGINVVTTSSAGMMHPPTHDPTRRRALEAAAATGGATVYATGMEPGFAGDFLPLVLTTMSRTVRSVRVQELFRYDSYPVAGMMFDGLGFGRPMEFEPLVASPEVQAALWGPSLRKIADHLGLRVDAIRCTYQKALTPRALRVACGVIEAGTVGAVRFETIAVANGRDAIVIEHVNRMADDLGDQDWPTAARDGVYRVLIEGEPNMTCEFMLGRPETASDDGMIATAMLMVNAVPYVCEAPPGLVTALDLPLTTPRFAFG